jgi:hypothetical protein
VQAQAAIATLILFMEPAHLLQAHKSHRTCVSILLNEAKPHFGTSAKCGCVRVYGATGQCLLPDRLVMGSQPLQASRSKLGVTSDLVFVIKHLSASQEHIWSVLQNEELRVAPVWHEIT